MKKIIYQWLPVILWMLAIFLFSAISDPYNLLPAAWRTITPLPRVSSSSLPELIGQILHFVEYAVLAILILRALVNQKLITKKVIVYAFLLTLAYAFSDEIHQVFVPKRTFQIFDLVVDLLGTVTGIFIYARRKKKAIFPANLPPSPY